MEGSPIPVLTVPTVPYEDQRPAGGGGLRRPTGLFEGQRNYLPNFIQSVLSSIDLRDRQGCTMVVGSDGRYFSKTATEIVVQMAAANGVSDLSPLTLASHHAAATTARSCRPRSPPFSLLPAAPHAGPTPTATATATATPAQRLPQVLSLRSRKDFQGSASREPATSPCALPGSLPRARTCPRCFWASSSPAL